MKARAGVTGCVALAFLFPAVVLSAATPVTHGAVVMTEARPVRRMAQDERRDFQRHSLRAPPAANDAGTAPADASLDHARDATRFGPVCLNPRAKAGGTPARARTAFPINIATPSLPPAKRPVLMLIYGGAFSAGSGAELFDEAAMVFNPRGILLVSLNYRLGRLGFFSHPACGRSSPACPPATWPMDQVAALRWVKAKVGRFGGDPAKVTIMGCSAGGASINALMATPAARGLLARASAHSSGGTNNAIRPP